MKRMHTRLLHAVHIEFNDLLVEVDSRFCVNTSTCFTFPLTTHKHTLVNMLRIVILKANTFRCFFPLSLSFFVYLMVQSFKRCAHTRFCLVGNGFVVLFVSTFIDVLLIINEHVIMHYIYSTSVMIVWAESNKELLIKRAIRITIFILYVDNWNCWRLIVVIGYLQWKKKIVIGLVAYEVDVVLDQRCV